MTVSAARVPSATLESNATPSTFVESRLARFTAFGPFRCSPESAPYSDPRVICVLLVVLCTCRGARVSGCEQKFVFVFARTAYCELISPIEYMKRAREYTHKKLACSRACAQTERVTRARSHRDVSADLLYPSLEPTLLRDALRRGAQLTRAATAPPLSPMTALSRRRVPVVARKVGVGTHRARLRGEASRAARARRGLAEDV